MHLKIPPVNYIIYRALVESMERKRPQEGTRRSGSTSRRISVFALLERLLNCGLWITLSTQERQHELQQLHSAHIHPTCSRGNKGEVNTPIRGPAPIWINRSDSGHRRSCPTGFLGKNKDGFFTMLNSQTGRLLLPPRGTEPPPFAAFAVARGTGDLR